MASESSENAFEAHGQPAMTLDRLHPIILQHYNSQYPALFLQEAKEVSAYFSLGILKNITHIGSTAIPHITAKPVIDMLVEIENFEKAKDIVRPALCERNYLYYWRDDRHPPHMMFIKGLDSPTEPTFHLHMAPKEHSLWDRVYFKDYLISHASIAKQYERLKIQLAKEYKYDRQSYTDGKAEFVKRITQQAKEFYKNNG